MRTEEEIKERIAFAQGYMAGLGNSCTAKDIEINKTEIDVLKWVLEEKEWDKGYFYQY